MAPLVLLEKVAPVDHPMALRVLVQVLVQNHQVRLLEVPEHLVLQVVPDHRLGTVAQDQVVHQLVPPDLVSHLPEDRG